MHIEQAGGIDEPPAREAFDRFKVPAGARSLRLDLSGLSIELFGLPDDLADAALHRYAPYVGPVTGAAAPLRVQVLAAPLDYFIPPDQAQAWQVYRVATAYDGSVFRSASYRLAGWFDIARRAGQIALARGDLDPAPRALENFLRGAVAWMAIDRGGLFLHGAGIVRGGACYVFFGPSGSGKSTLAAMSRGADVISDDLTLVLRRQEGLRVTGIPFRGTYAGGAPVTGEFPIAGLYRLRKDARTFVRGGDAACFADLLGNLPWIVDQLPRHPHLIDRVRQAVVGVPFRYLHFRKDEDFWPAIDQSRTSGPAPIS